LPSSADFKLHIGYIRDSRNIILQHRPLLKEDLDIEKKKEEEYEDTLPSSADFKLHVGYTRDSRIINLLHRSFLNEDLDIEKKKEEKERRKKNMKIHCQALQNSNSILGTQETAGSSTFFTDP
jgi:hypothetical protein